MQAKGTRANGGKLFAILFGLPLLLIVPVALVGSSVLHAGSIECHVMDKTGHSTSLGVTVPAALVPVALHLAPEVVIDDVRCEMGPEARQGIEIARAALRELGRAPDGVLVEVRSSDEIVFIEKKDGAFHILVDTPQENVRVSVPIRTASSVLDAII
jgi:hypothetical protein